MLLQRNCLVGSCFQSASRPLCVPNYNRFRSVVRASPRALPSSECFSLIAAHPLLILAEYLFRTHAATHQQWIQNLERENKLTVIKLTDGDYLRTLENAVQVISGSAALGPCRAGKASH